jgi:hypothetical protein
MMHVLVPEEKGMLLRDGRMGGGMMGMVATPGLEDRSVTVYRLYQTERFHCPPTGNRSRSLYFKAWRAYPRGQSRRYLKR